MKYYKVNEIFYSLQGEGFWAGTGMIFVRFSGCNRRCSFCNTAHSSYRSMTARQILEEVCRVCPSPDVYPTPRICFTGGEPLLQLDKHLLEAIRGRSMVHLETNGEMEATFPAELLDWVTVSPKGGLEDIRGPTPEDGGLAWYASEVKLVYPTTNDRPGPEVFLWKWATWPGRYGGSGGCSHPPLHYLQPMFVAWDLALTEFYLRRTVQYVMEHPEWRLSLQQHRLLNIR